MDVAVNTGSGAAAEPVKPVSDATVGVFDSGIGGFTVAGAILRRRPSLNLVYYGDNINMPYGGRAPEQIARFARHSIEFLLEHSIDMLAVGCNASNSVLGQGDLKSFGIPVYDLVGSTIDHYRAEGGLPAKLAIVATEATINSGYWHRKLKEAFPDLALLDIAAPEFVPLVEAAQPDLPAMHRAIKKYLGGLQDQGISTVLHGCTHYPLMQAVMEEVVPGLTYIDPAVCLAEKMLKALPEAPADTEGELRIFSSLPGMTFYRTGAAALGRAIRDHTTMYIVSPREED